MADVKFKLNSKGVQELLKGPKMRAIISGAAASVASSANSMGSGGYTATVKTGAKRCYANIGATTYKAYMNNLKHNTLIKALGSTRV